MELPSIGQNCAVSNCNQLDFLPFKCDHCGKVFCLQHRSPDDHLCTNVCYEHQEYQGERSYPCSISGCEGRELTPIVCQHCSLSFCLSHRLQEDHSCVKLSGRAKELTKTTEHVQKLLAQKEFKPKVLPTNPKAIQMAAKISLMKLKGKATGDQGLPQQERVYLNVLPPLESQRSSLPIFVSKMWSVGRVIDIAAEKASIPNKNNTNAIKKLGLFHADTGARLSPSARLEDLLQDENILLLNGSAVVLEHVEDTLQVLENVKLYKR